MPAGIPSERVRTGLPGGESTSPKGTPSNARGPFPFHGVENQEPMLGRLAKPIVVFRRLAQRRVLLPPFPSRFSLSPRPTEAASADEEFGRLSARLLRAPRSLPLPLSLSFFLSFFFRLALGFNTSPLIATPL